MEKDYRELYEKITNSDWFKKAYHNKSLGECPIVVEELEESEDERIRKEILDFIQLCLSRTDFGSRSIALRKEDAEMFEKWIAYLESHKEQIPYIDFVIKPHKGDDNNPYDMSVSEAQEYAINRGFGIPYNDGEVYIDERHMTQTIGNILRWADEHPKEQNTLSTEETELNSLAFLEQMGYTCIPPGKEQKPVHTAREIWKEMRLEVYAQASGNRHEPNYSDDSTKMFSLTDIDEIFEKITEKQSEQKPVYEDEYQKMLADSYKSGKNEVIDNPEKYGLQKPAEWSEEDAEILNAIVVFISGYADKRVVSRWVEFLKSLLPQSKQEVPKDAETLTAKLVNLLKSYRIGEKTAVDLADRIADTYGVQRYLDGVCDASKQEWSEDDETRLKVIEEELERYIMFKQYGTPLSVDDIEWLKSLPERFNLPPKQEWNEEDEKQEEQKPKVWKPSKEQMEALYNIEFKEFKKFGPIIESLYNDLKKL